MKDSTFISIIICTFNRSGLLNNCLETLALQTECSKKFEVLVIDNNSMDDTEKVVSNYHNKIPDLRYIFEVKQGLSYARNTGCLESNGDYIVYLDDDAKVHQDYINNLMNVIEKYSPDIFGGPVYPYYTTKKPWWFSDEYEIRKYADQSGFSRTCNVSGGNFIIKKDILLKLGMFDPNYGVVGNKLAFMEERKVLDIYRKLFIGETQKVYYSLECPILHHVPKEKMRIGYILKRRFLAGKYKIRMGTDLGQKYGLSYIYKDIKSTYINIIKKEFHRKGIFRSDFLLFLFVFAGMLGKYLEVIIIKFRIKNNTNSENINA